MPPVNAGRLTGNRRFLLFFMSQNFVACGALIQVIAVARLLVSSTSSGLTAGFGMVCAPIPGILFSLLAGSLGDRLNSKRLLIAFDLCRGSLVLLYSVCRAPLPVFSLMTLVNLLNVLYSPSKNKLLTSLLDQSDLIRGNSVLSGGYGAVSLVIPALAGLLVIARGVGISFLLSGGAYFLSALMLSGLNAGAGGLPKSKPDRRQDITKGLNYCLGKAPLRKAILLLAALDFGTVSVNIAFYSLAFDTLQVSSGAWGVLLSVLYGMNLVSMLLLLRFKKDFRINPLLKAPLLLMAVALSWLYYSVTRNPLLLLAGAAVEGLCGSLLSVMLLTHIQETSRQDYMARVTGTRELFSNIAKITGVGLTYLLMIYYGINVIFLINASLVFAFAAIQSITGTITDRRHTMS